MSLNPDPVEALIAAFHRRRPIRAWSLIVTFFGDIVAPRGGEISMQSLSAVLDAAGVQSGVVRQAMSRLAQDGWVTRKRSGRSAFYLLSEMGRAEVAAAAPRIYGKPPDASATTRPRFLLALLAAAGADGDAARTVLKAHGFVSASALVLWRLVDPSAMPAPIDAPAGVVIWDATLASGAGHALPLLQAAWNIEHVAAGYAHVAGLAMPVIADLPREPMKAIVARLLLVHEFRRVALRDPQLPPVLLPSGWRGPHVRTAVARAYAGLLPLSEQWLDNHATVRDGPLPPPAEPLFARFQT